MSAAGSLGITNRDQHILPLTREDITGQNGSVDTNNDDLASVATSLQSSATGLASFAQRQRNRLRRKRMDGSLNAKFKLPRYFKRLFNIRSLDFESSVWDMVNMVARPKQVYKTLYYQKETRGKWSRDDPSFVLLLCGLLTVSAICWGIFYTSSLGSVFKLILQMVVVDFLLVGSVVATFGWIVGNRFFLKSDAVPDDGYYTYSRFSFGKLFPRNSPLEWAYCFDVHCNAYMMIWFFLYLIQFVLLPVLRMDNIVSTLLGNTLYVGAFSYYAVITFYGYNILPFLQRTEYMLLPIPVFASLWLIFTICGFNFANYMCNMYFS